MKKYIIIVISVITISCKSQNKVIDNKNVEYNIDTIYYTKNNYKKIHPKDIEITELYWKSFKEFFETDFFEKMAKDIGIKPCDTTVNLKFETITSFEKDNFAIYSLNGNEIFQVHNTHLGLQKLVEYGFLNSILYCKTKKRYLFDLQELLYMDIPETRRRYTFLVRTDLDAHYTIGLIEILNEKGKKKDSFLDFIRNAKIVKFDISFTIY